MKKKVLLLLLALCFWLGLPQWGVGQTSFNFASAYTGVPYSDMKSLIRTIDDTSALVYYYDYSADSGVIARVGLTLSCRKALLPKGCRVNDMRITGDNVYFCGHLQADPVYSKCWYETYRNWTFNCLSRLTDTVYVASGGEYWCLKDIYPLTPDSCYKTDSIEITPIKTVKYAKETDTYYHRSNFVNFLYRRTSYENEFLFPSCIINN